MTRTVLLPRRPATEHRVEDLREERSRRRGCRQRVVVVRRSRCPRPRTAGRRRTRSAALPARGVDQELRERRGDRQVLRAPQGEEREVVEVVAPRRAARPVELVPDRRHVRGRRRVRRAGRSAPRAGRSGWDRSARGSSRSSCRTSCTSRASELVNGRSAARVVADREVVVRPSAGNRSSRRRRAGSGRPRRSGRDRRTRNRRAASR